MRPARGCRATRRDLAGKRRHHPCEATTVPTLTAAADADIGLGTVIDAHLAEAGFGPGDEGLVEGPGRRRRPRRRPERLAAPGGRAGLHRGTAAASGRTVRGTARSAPRPSPGSQQLITLLAADPPVPDAEISARLGIRPAASGRPAAAAWTSCASTQPSPRSLPPKHQQRDDVSGNALAVAVTANGLVRRCLRRPRRQVATPITAGNHDYYRKSWSTSDKKPQIAVPNKQPAANHGRL